MWVARRPRQKPAEEVAAEAEKGHDLLVIGVDPMLVPDGGLRPAVGRLATEFRGAVAIVSARAAHLVSPESAGLDILVAVNGTEVSRRGVEIALTLARASNARVTAIYVVPERDGRRGRARFGNTSGTGEAVLKEIVALAESMEMEISTAVRVTTAPEDAVLRQARIGGHNLIVMGVSARSRNRLAFGPVATAVLEASERSVLFLTA